MENNAPQTELDRFIDIVVNGDTEALRSFPNVDKMINARDEQDWTPLMWAAATGQMHTAQILLGRGAHMDAQGKKGETALMCAADSNDEAILLLLIHAGAKADLKNHAGETVRDILEQLGSDELLAKINTHVAAVATRAEQPIAVRKPLVLKKPGL
jgi:ankyrin repeat protein